MTTTYDQIVDTCPSAEALHRIRRLNSSRPTTAIYDQIVDTCPSAEALHRIRRLNSSKPVNRFCLGCDSHDS